MSYQKPKILNKPAHENVIYGSKLEMDCEVTGDYEMNWYKNYRSVTLKNTNSTHRKNNGMYISRKRLTIEKFTKDDEAFYICEAKRKGVGWVGLDGISVKIGKGKGDIFNFTAWVFYCFTEYNDIKMFYDPIQKFLVKNELGIKSIIATV